MVNILLAKAVNMARVIQCDKIGDENGVGWDCNLQEQLFRVVSAIFMVHRVGLILFIVYPIKKGLFCRHLTKN
jgi:hypothetical protein